MDKLFQDYVREVTEQEGRAEDLVGRFEQYQRAARNLFVDKQRSYGHGNIAEFGFRGVVIRSNDKMARQKNIAFRGGSVGSGESLLDTSGDMANYGIIGAMTLAEHGDLTDWDLDFVDPDTGDRKPFVLTARFNPADEEVTKVALLEQELAFLREQLKQAKEDTNLSPASGNPGWSALKVGSGATMEFTLPVAPERPTTWRDYYHRDVGDEA